MSKADEFDNLVHGLDLQRSMYGDRDGQIAKIALDYIILNRDIITDALRAQDAAAANG